MMILPPLYKYQILSIICYIYSSPSHIVYLLLFMYILLDFFVFHLRIQFDHYYICIKLRQLYRFSLRQLS